MAIWNIRFYIDSETDQPHIYGHHVTEDEAAEILLNASEDRHGEEGAREWRSGKLKLGAT